jgi:cardiolipin synthase
VRLGRVDQLRNRSFRLNDEVDLKVLDTDFAREQVEIFEADRARSRRVTLEEWKRRPFSERIIEHASALLRPLL